MTGKQVLKGRLKSDGSNFARGYDETIYFYEGGHLMCCYVDGTPRTANVAELAADTGPFTIFRRRPKPRDVFKQPRVGDILRPDDRSGNYNETVAVVTFQGVCLKGNDGSLKIRNHAQLRKMDETHFVVEKASP